MTTAWRERYIAKQNARLRGLLSDTNSDKSETDRFWEAHELINEQAKILQICLDHHSRSRMHDKLGSMTAAGMIQRADLADFSEVLQKQIFG